MIFINAFLLSGFLCMVGQIILDNTKLTAGHITSIFVCVGSFLSFFEIYPKLIEVAGAGATIPITNFGNMLYQSGIIGYESGGILGIFSNLLDKSSLAISSAIIFSFIFSCIFKPKN